MQKVILLLLISTLVLGCRKGKKLPEIVYVHYDGISEAGISPQGAFAHFDPFDIYEIDRYPSYVSTSQSGNLAEDFNEDLIDYLKKNNVVLTSDPAEYTLKVTYLGVSESLNRSSYVDSCSLSNETSYVYYSSLTANVHASLWKNGYKIDSWDRNSGSTERLRDKTDNCNQPKVLSARSPETLCNQLARELRMKVANKLYDLEVK